MQIYKSEDGNVIKCVHEDLSETTIKLNSTCDGQVVQSNKATVFISVSYGCNQGCKMCYLSIKRCGYKKLSAKDIISNVVDSLYTCRDVLKDKYIKLSFMGMGDVALLDPVDIIYIVRDLIDYIQEHYECIGFHSVDFGTSYPSSILRGDLSGTLNLLGDYLITNKIHIPDLDRRPVRLFLSLHSAMHDKRRSLLPCSYLSHIEDFIDDNLERDFDIILHYTLIDGVNNSEKDISKLKKFMRQHYTDELRLLRYNSCEGTDLKEPSEESYKYFIDSLSNQGFKFKYQLSTGSELKAACGQFLLKEVV